MEREGRKGIFAQERETLQRHSRSIAVMLVVTCVCVATIWFLFVSGYWVVNRIDVEGLHDLKREEVASSTYDVLDHGSWKPWNRRTIFYVKPSALAAQLQEALFAESVTVEKVYPNVLRLKIQERQRSVVLATKGQFLLVDTNGLVTAEADGKILESAQHRLANSAMSGLSDLPFIKTDLPEPATAGYQATGADTIKMLIRAYKALVESKIAFRYLQMPSLSATELDMVLDQGIQIRMDLSEPLDVQVMTYQKFMATKGKGFQPKEYIDVRVPGKVFAK